MGISTFMIAGGLMGLLGYFWLKINPKRGLIFSVIVAVIGSVLGGAMLVPLFETVPVGPDTIDVLALVTACATAFAGLIITDMIYERFKEKEDIVSR
jgi:uncharacterized membrane protein YeaQ/YmgE (transglycosylase-associated protein family)